MDRIWQWAWDRYGARYTWAMCATAFAVVLPVFLFTSFVVVAFEKSGHYVGAAAVTVVAVLVMCYVFIPPGGRRFRLVEQWAAGHEVDRAKALEDTYTYARSAVARAVAGNAVLSAVLLVVVGAIAGAMGPRLVEYGILGASTGIAVQLIAIHSFVEAALRPARVALAGDTALARRLRRGRTCPCSRSRSRSPWRAHC
jgi:adenylate cyclase